METMLEPQLELEVENEPTRILIVDDDPDQTIVLNYYLSKQGFQIEIAHSAAEGKKKVSTFRPNLILLDIELPDASGFNVCQEITDDPVTCEIPIIFVSGADFDNALRDARFAGCAFYVRKPYDPNVLLVLIQKTLDEAI